MPTQVLLIEDSRAMRDYVSSILEAEGSYEVIEVSNGFDALRALPRDEYGLIVTDVNMPDVSGIEITHFVRHNQRHAQTPIVVISTDSSEVDRRRAMAAGASAFLAKPFTSEELLEIVGLAHRRDHKPAQLSGGEQQRVAIAVALANRPPLLLADEPTGERDVDTAAEVLTLLNNVNQELGTTIVIVTHDPAISTSVGRAVAIRDGKTSTETTRAVSFERKLGGDTSDVEEFLLVDSSGSVQIPREVLDDLSIRRRVRLGVTDGRVTLESGE